MSSSASTFASTTRPVSAYHFCSEGIRSSVYCVKSASVLLDEIVGSNDCAGLNGAERWPLEAVLIHTTPAGLSPRLIPSSPQSLNFFSNSMCGLLCLLDFSLIWGGSGNQGQQAQCAISRRSPIPVPQTPLAFLRRAQRNAFRRRDAHQQSRL